MNNFAGNTKIEGSKLIVLDVRKIGPDLLSANRFDFSPESIERIKNCGMDILVNGEFPLETYLEMSHNEYSPECECPHVMRDHGIIGGVIVCPGDRGLYSGEHLVAIMDKPGMKRDEVIYFIAREKPLVIEIRK